jgi:hypothetical protein
MKLAIVGSTKINDEQLSAATAFMQGIIQFYMPELIISGGAVGVDTAAENEAKRFLIKSRIFLPENPRWEPEGYKVRNTKIAEECTHMLCIRTNQSTTYGSGWTADKAQKLGKVVWRVRI